MILTYTTLHRWTTLHDYHAAPMITCPTPIDFARPTHLRPALLTDGHDHTGSCVYANFSDGDRVAPGQFHLARATLKSGAMAVAKACIQPRLRNAWLPADPDSLSPSSA